MQWLETQWALVTQYDLPRLELEWLQYWWVPALIIGAWAWWRVCRWHRAKPEPVPQWKLDMEAKAREVEARRGEPLATKRWTPAGHVVSAQPVAMYTSIDAPAYVHWDRLRDE
jgi:hypothetical protein